VASCLVGGGSRCVRPASATARRRFRPGGPGFRRRRCPAGRVLAAVAVAAAVFLPGDVAGLGQAGDDAVGAARGDAQAGRDVAHARRVLCRAVIGGQGGSRSKRQAGRPASRDGPPLADLRAVRRARSLVRRAFAPGVAGHTAPWGECPGDRERFSCAAFACAASPGAGWHADGTSKASVASPAAR
jgi:hypothetical protein